MNLPNLSRRQLLATVGALALTPGCATSRFRSGIHEIELVTRLAVAALRAAPQPGVAVWTYGGRVPGPEIRLVQGSRLRVNVLNQLPEDTTVHWHGVRVPISMDGVPFLTQPPIQPGHQFTYEFDVRDAGTYWYHSHQKSAEQVERGLYGALIVEEREPITVDRDLTWVLDDWRLTREGQISGTFMHPTDVAHAGRIGNVVTLNGSVPGDVAIRRGERLRIRLINAANARIFGLVFDGHDPLVVAIDGQPVTPHAPPNRQIILAPGMRVDLVLDAVGEAAKRYAVGDIFYPRAAYDLLHLRYGDAGLRERLLSTPVRLAPNPLAEPDMNALTAHEIRFQGGMMGSLHGATLDGKPMNMMGLMRAGKAWAVNGVVAGGHSHEPALTLRRGQSYLLALVNDTRWHHPIHLHGHSFRVLRRNGRPTPHQEWQDTVLMAPDERVDVALVADNPGDWMLHCHILEHQDGGLMTVARVA